MCFDNYSKEHVNSEKIFISSEKDIKEKTALSFEYDEAMTYGVITCCPNCKTRYNIISSYRLYANGFDTEIIECMSCHTKFISLDKSSVDGCFAKMQRIAKEKQDEIDKRKAQEEKNKKTPSTEGDYYFLVKLCGRAFETIYMYQSHDYDENNEDFVWVQYMKKSLLQADESIKNDKKYWRTDKMSIFIEDIIVYKSNNRIPDDNIDLIELKQVYHDFHEENAASVGHITDAIPQDYGDHFADFEDIIGLSLDDKDDVFYYREDLIGYRNDVKDIKKHKAEKYLKDVDWMIKFLEIRKELIRKGIRQPFTENEVEDRAILQEQMETEFPEDLPENEGKNFEELINSLTPRQLAFQRAKYDLGQDNKIIKDILKDKFKLPSDEECMEVYTDYMTNEKRKKKIKEAPLKVEKEVSNEEKEYLEKKYANTDLLKREVDRVWTYVMYDSKEGGGCSVNNIKIGGGVELLHKKCDKCVEKPAVVKIDEDNYVCADCFIEMNENLNEMITNGGLSEKTRQKNLEQSKIGMKEKLLKEYGEKPQATLNKFLKEIEKI